MSAIVRFRALDLLELVESPGLSEQAAGPTVRYVR